MKDKKLIQYLISNNEKIKIYESDNTASIQIKSIINNAVDKDYSYKTFYRYHKRKKLQKHYFIWHSYYEFKNIVLNKINQIRQKNFYYKPLKM